VANGKARVASEIESKTETTTTQTEDGKVTGETSK
jgi:hypothetical protein